MLPLSCLGTMRGGGAGPAQKPGEEASGGGGGQQSLSSQEEADGMSRFAKAFRQGLCGLNPE